MTNGGLVAIRSYRSPRTGSKKDPSTHLDPVADLVEDGVEPRDAERPLVDVGRDDVAAVRGEVQCLHAAAGAEVEAVVDRNRAG